MNETENTQAFNAQTTELCESLIGCKLRNEYVKAVYESMSKGQHGDFDFN